MKRLFEQLLLLLVLVSAAGAAAAGTQRFAVVNLEKVFREYYKSRIAEDAIKQQAEVYRGYLVKQNSQLIQLKREAEQLRSDAQNPALAEEERTRLGAEAVVKAREVAAKEAELQLYAAERTRAMREIEQKKRGEIMADIYQEIDRRAAAEGFNFVFDSSGKTLNDQPLVLRFPPSCDLTDAVIRELNRTKSTPAEAKPAETKPAAPVEAKPGEAKPAAPAPAETKPAEAKPAEAKPAAPAPSEAKPGEAKPAAPAETKPGEAKPAAPKP